MGRDRMGFEQIPAYVFGLVQYKAHTEGAIIPEREMRAELIEIIRWHTNATAALQRPRNYNVEMKEPGCGCSSCRRNGRYCH